MGRITLFRDMIGVIKDKASLSKATILSKSSLHFAVLRATSHAPSTTPADHHLSTLLSVGDGSRASASALIESLMDRLHSTRNSSVALKCLLTIHHIIQRGPFILQDQLSVFPATGGHNYLNLSAFRDGSTAATWLLSAWVRWYALYLETLISTCRTLGFFFLTSSSGVIEKEKQAESVSWKMNDDLIRDVNSLIGVVEELCKIPDQSFVVEGNKLLPELIFLVENDYSMAVNEIMLRLGEFKERLSHLSSAESFELVCNLKRLDEHKERMSMLFNLKEPSVEILWGLIEEIKSKNGVVEEGKSLTNENKERVTESARFGERVLKSIDSVKFSSSRFGLNKYYFLESTNYID